MPHDGPDEPSWLERRPHIRRAYYLGLAAAAIGFLSYLFGPEWVTGKLDAAFAFALSWATGATP